MTTCVPMLACERLFIDPTHSEDVPGGRGTGSDEDGTSHPKDVDSSYSRSGFPFEIHIKPRLRYNPSIDHGNKVGQARVHWRYCVVCVKQIKPNIT